MPIAAGRQQWTTANPTGLSLDRSTHFETSPPMSPMNHRFVSRRVTAAFFITLAATTASVLGQALAVSAQSDTSTTAPTGVSSVVPTTVTPTATTPAPPSSSTTPASATTAGPTSTSLTATSGAPTTTSAAQVTTTTPFVVGKVLRQGSKGPEVAAMERKLDLLRYDVGSVDGRFDSQTWQGLVAFQKLHGLKRTGKFDEDTQRELALAGVPGGLIPNGGLPRVEVDISRQILMYFDEFGLNRVVAVSSGSGRKYCETSKLSGKENCGDARTPRGNYRIERRIKGKRESDLGILYSPMYFTGGFAIHGSPSIPAYPASHGCVRISNRTADWMFEDVKNGTPVYVFD